MIYDRVVDLNQSRIHGRLESAHWRIPKKFGTKKRSPLHERLQRLSAYLASIPSDNSDTRIALLIDQMTRLSQTLRKVDERDVDSYATMDALKVAVKESYDLCTSGGDFTLEATISSYGFLPSKALSHQTIRKLDKIGRYWGLCKSLAVYSRAYADVFAGLELHCLPPYQAKNSKIAFDSEQNARCLVHAEIQLLIFHNLQAHQGMKKPRVIGVSKSCCYLCNLFILQDDRYFITKTHGQLYERWTFPDLQDFGQEERQKYCRILQAINEEIIATCHLESTHLTRRTNPMGSWVTLPSAQVLFPIVSTLDSSASPTANDGDRLPQAHMSPLPGLVTSSEHVAEVTRAPAADISRLDLAAGSPNDFLASSGDVKAGIDIPNRASSARSIASWEYPVEKDVIPSSPYLAYCGNLSLIVEVEAPAHDRVRIGKVSNEENPPVTTIDPQVMKPGEKELFSMVPNDKIVRLNILTDRQCLSVDLSW